MQVVIEIPKEVLYDTKQTIEQATDFAKRATALGFYKQYGGSVELCSQINRERIYRLFRRKWCFRMEIEKRYKMLTDT